MIKLITLSLASFDLFLVVCYLILLWEKNIRSWLSILCTKSSFNQCNEQQNQNYQNHKGYYSNQHISPRMFIKPILNDSPNDNESYRSHKYCQGGILLFLRHALSFFPKICIRVYKLFGRSQPKGNDTTVCNSSTQTSPKNRQPKNTLSKGRAGICSPPFCWLSTLLLNSRLLKAKALIGCRR